MDGRVRRITEVLRQRDRRLFAIRSYGGVIKVLRQADHLDASDHLQEEPDLSRLNPQFILALTTDWTLNGEPVEWGLEPLMRKLEGMDGWSRESDYQARVRRRERVDEERARARRNEFKALAADCRKDFAKATNDINTATLEKVDLRRMKDGNS